MENVGRRRLGNHLKYSGIYFENNLQNIQYLSFHASVKSKIFFKGVVIKYIERKTLQDLPFS